MDTFEGADGSIRLTLALGSYRLTAIKKAAYRLADRCTIELGAPNELTVDVTLHFKPSVTTPQKDEVTRAFFQELLDQELRELVAEEVGPVRTLILAHAFSKTNLVRSE
ncbi:His-Xaa-Ser system protein HxsD [Pendulispora brunnea]|uniref:His-Xaa-Ser system protein HxsD n=1 Tax=Pendulispora brunnea TaxID=2905690 RepID=A0ABZ2JYH9_9BACT